MTVIRVAAEHVRMRQIAPVNHSQDVPNKAHPAPSTQCPVRLRLTKKTAPVLRAFVFMPGILALPDAPPRNSTVTYYSSCDVRDGLKGLPPQCLALWDMCPLPKENANIVLACRTAKFGAHPRREEDEYHSVKIPTFRGPSSCQKRTNTIRCS